MAVKTFKGGAHPPERKERSSGLAIERLRDVTLVVVPVNQHFGAPLQSLVKVGDKVKRGQKIADAEGRMTVPVHAPIAGVVKKIEPRTQSNNVEGPCILIEAFGPPAEGEPAPLPEDLIDFMLPLDPFACSKEEALARVRAAGIVGMGGAGFPAHIKLAPSKPIAVVIANGAECEPFLTIDERTMIERADDVVEGVAITMKIVNAPEGVIAVEENKAHAVPLLEKSIAASPRTRAGMKIRVQLLKTKYPQGGEKMLITAITGKEVPSGGLPMDVGCVVQNIGTLCAMVDAFKEGKPLIERGLTISGGACTKPANVIAPIGTPVADILAAGLAQVDEEKLGMVIYGGPMMGVAVPNYQIPVQKNTSGVLLLDAAEAKHYEEETCIRCGRCMRACSCRLSPALLAAAIEAGDYKEAEKIGLLDCIECGTCSFVCPSHRHLVQRFRVGKQVLRALKQKEAQNAR
ncbi:MAG: electron transport complex subunit RsxC [Spirochaetia bacterium]|jgi:electron transport complex protein RnfC|nr:electron transport complex subunit RsxC [Spirochaetia bacterium]